MMALLSVTRGSQRIRFIDDKEGVFRLTSLSGDDLKRLIDKRTHVANSSYSSHLSAELKEHRWLFEFSCETVTRCFGCGGFPSTDIPFEKNKRVSVGYNLTERENRFMKLFTPGM